MDLESGRNDMDNFKLDQHPKISSGFTAPDAYFETLYERIATRSDDHDIPAIPLWRRPIVLVAASMTAVLLAVTLLYRPGGELPEAAAIEQYLISNDAISYDELAAQFDANDLEQIAPALGLDPAEIEETLTHYDVEHLIDTP